MANECPKCNAENPDTQSFCGDCGTKLGTPKDIPVHTKTLETPFPQFSPGTSLANRYKIIEELGRGGMGEVYLAEDTNLKRQVAIKVLPITFSLHKESLARFEREARLLASLNHPNIATIYGFEKLDDRRFLVMELVEGNTLAERIKKGPLPVDETLEVCKQIAEGLESAHEKGIIHRDLKPGNIKITLDGKVKILDFGLAKAFQDEPEAIDLSKSPTLTDRMTQPGVILGTAAYMSPEQARGHPIDKRTDIWAFGCILYECLTGEMAFRGETFSDTLAQILKSEPDWTALPESTPPVIKSLLGRCLQRDRRNRQRDIADARIEMEEASKGQPVSVAGTGRRPVRPWIWGALVSGPILVAIVAALVTWNLRPEPELRVVRSTLMLEPGYRLEGGNVNERPTRTAMAISSDGRFVIYCGYPVSPAKESRSMIYMRKMNEIDAKPVEGTEDSYSPFLSPDNRWIGFWVGAGLKKVPVEGGVPTTLGDFGGSFGADWGADNTIIFTPSNKQGLSRISDQGGQPEVLTIPDGTRGEFSHRLPRFLPGGRAVLFTIMENAIDLHPRLAILDMDNGEWHEVMEDAADGRYLSTGHLIFLRQGTLMAVAFDLNRLKPKGEPAPLIGNVAQALNLEMTPYNTSAGQYYVSDSGWLAYAPGGIFPDIGFSFMRVDQKGDTHLDIDLKVPDGGFPRFSPNGERIAYITVGEESKLWIYDLNRETSSPLTDEGIVVFPVWMPPDGKRLVFAWHKTGVSNLYWQPADGSLPKERLTTSVNYQFPSTFTPDGKILAFVETQNKGDILLLDMESREVTPFLNSKAFEGFPDISPDGNWLAYVSDESGQAEVWVRPFPGSGAKYKISNAGGISPIWSKNGSQLFYRDFAGNQVWVVDIRLVGGFSPSKPRLLFEKHFDTGWPIRNWDLWPGGKGFLMMKPENQEPPPVTEIILVENWFEELKQLAPVKK